MPDKLLPRHLVPAAMARAPDWKPDGDAVLAHPGLAVRYVHVARLKEDGSLAHDTVVRTEAGGGAFLPVDAQGRVGLIKMWRMQAQDMDAFVARLPEVDWERVGRVSFEIPAGFSNPGEPGFQAALREAEEETGARVTHAELLGPVCDNRAFSVHLTSLAWGRLDQSTPGTAAPDAHEPILGGLEFFTLAGLRALQQSGLLYDGFTLSALGLLLLHHPGLLANG